jgi:hypothetical protein
MREEPVAEDVVLAAAQGQDARDDIDAWCRQVIAEIPLGIERRRYCQAARTDPDAVYADYLALLADNPEQRNAPLPVGSGLAGRRGDGPVHPGYRARPQPCGLAYLALANRGLATSDDWSAALALRDQAWHVDPFLPWTTIRSAGA